MKKYLSILLFLTTGCFQYPFQSFENDSAFPDKMFLQLWAEVEKVSNTDINLEKFHIHIYEDATAFSNHCLDLEKLGCTDAVSYMNVLGSVGYSAVDVATTAAHLFGHIYYMQSEDNPDGQHTHIEWFSEDDPCSVVETIKLEAKALE